VLHQIGAGTLGPVFRAYEPDRDRLVAVKLFGLDLPPERVHQLVAEFEQLITADLDHAVIVAPRATGIAGVNAYLAQDYVTADSLDIVVRESGPAAVSDALRVAAQLAKGLDYAAARQVVHGALHPRDVLLSTDGPRPVSLVGLGVTRALEHVSATAPVRRPYTAPERMAGGAWDRRADVFSLAAVIHELLWGRRPAGTGAQAADALTETAGGDLAALRRVFACALADDMADRFATATAFAEALAEAFVEKKSASLRPGARRSLAPRLVAEPKLPLDALDPLGNDKRPGDDFDHLHPEPELTLRTLEPPRYLEVEPRRDIVGDDVPRRDVVDVEVTAPPLPMPETRAPEPPGFLSTRASAEPPASSLVWPLALAALVGSALGFGAGYAVAIRDRSNAATSVGVSSTPSAQQAGRDFTEGTVGESQGDVGRPRAGNFAQPRVAKPGAPAIPPASRPAAAAPGAAALAAPLFAGRVLVRSTPPGARVFVDGRSGGETPATVRDLARGAHQVRLVHEGYTTVERRIVVTASRPALSLTVPMVKAPVASARTPGNESAALVVESRPAGATVFVDGRPVGMTPLTLPGLHAGAHAVRIEIDGYRQWSSSVQVVGGEENRVTASLER
jgi:serine/threonine protein kinase